MRQQLTGHQGKFDYMRFKNKVTIDFVQTFRQEQFTKFALQQATQMSFAGDNAQFLRKDIH